LIFRITESSVADKTPTVGKGCFPVAHCDAAQQFVSRRKMRSGRDVRGFFVVIERILGEKRSHSPIV
jgi:hypothetical protein